MGVRVHIILQYSSILQRLKGTMCNIENEHIVSALISGPIVGIYSGAYIISLNMHISVAPLRLIPAQTCTFVGCLAL